MTVRAQPKLYHIAHVARLRSNAAGVDGLMARASCLTLRMLH